MYILKNIINNLTWMDKRLTDIMRKAAKRVKHL